MDIYKTIIEIGSFSIKTIIYSQLNQNFLIIGTGKTRSQGYNGEEIDMFFFNLEIKDNFELAETFYEIHIAGNYTLITLISLHIFAVIVHKLLFKENLLKRIL